MEISADCKAGLALLASSTTFTAAQAAALARVTVEDVLVRGGDATALLAGEASLRGLDARTVKHAHAAVATLFLEAARQHYDDELMGSLLAEHFAPREATVLGDLFRSRRDELRALLRATAFHLPHVVDVEWRMDFQLRSAALERIDQCHWLVTLRTLENGGRPADVRFACNREELQDLLAKLRDAVAAAERLAAAD